MKWPTTRDEWVQWLRQWQADHPDLPFTLNAVAGTLNMATPSSILAHLEPVWGSWSRVRDRVLLDPHRVPPAEWVRRGLAAFGTWPTRREWGAWAKTAQVQGPTASQLLAQVPGVVWDAVPEAVGVPSPVTAELREWVAEHPAPWYTEDELVPRLPQDRQAAYTAGGTHRQRVREALAAWVAPAPVLQPVSFKSPIREWLQLARMAARGWLPAAAQADWATWSAQTSPAQQEILTALLTPRPEGKSPTYQSIAEALGTTPQNVEKKVHRMADRWDCIRDEGFVPRPGRPLKDAKTGGVLRGSEEWRTAMCSQAATFYAVRGYWPTMAEWTARFPDTPAWVVAKEWGRWRLFLEDAGAPVEHPLTRHR